MRWPPGWRAEILESPNSFQTSQVSDSAFDESRVLRARRREGGRQGRERKKGVRKGSVPAIVVGKGSVPAIVEKLSFLLPISHGIPATHPQPLRNPIHRQYALRPLPRHHLHLDGVAFPKLFQILFGPPSLL